MLLVNSVALFFVVELDDMLVSSNSYDEIRKFIVSGNAKKEYGKEIPKCCWSGNSTCFVLPLVFLCFVATSIGLVLLPIWIVVCV